MTMHNIAACVFLLAFSLTFIRSLFFRDGEKYYKLTGAFAFLVIGLIVNEKLSWFCFIIGGLIVATEEFMLMLMVISRVEKHHIPEIMKSYFDLSGTSKNTANPKNVKVTSMAPPHTPDLEIPTI